MVKTILFVVGGLLFSTLLKADSFKSMEEMRSDFKMTLPVSGKTAKGINTWLIFDSDTPMVSMVYSFKSGRLLDAVGKEGISSFYINLLLGDRVDYKAQEILKALNDIQSHLNIYQDNSHLFIETKFPAIYMKEFQHILKCIFLDSNFTRSSFEKARIQLSGQSGMAYKSACSLATQLLNEKLYPNHIFSSFKRTGIPSISLKEMNQYAANYLNKDSAHVTAVGNISPQQLEEFVDNLMGGLPQERVVELPAIRKPTLSSIPGVFHIEKDDHQSTIVFGIRYPVIHHPDRPAALLLELILGKGDRSRLYKTLRSKLGVCYTPQTAVIHVTPEETFLKGVITVDQQNTQQTLDALFSIFEDLHSNGIKPQQLEDVKSRLIEELTLSMTSTLASADELEHLYTCNFGPDGLAKIKNSFENVTMEDIKRVAKIYFDPKKFTVVCVGPVAPVNGLLNQNVKSINEAE